MEARHGPLYHYPGPLPEGSPPVCTAQWTDVDFNAWQKIQEARQDALNKWLEKHGDESLCPNCYVNFEFKLNKKGE